MAIKDAVTDRILGPGQDDEREYRCDTCMTTFATAQPPDIASCPSCGAHHVRET